MYDHNKEMIKNTTFCSSTVSSENENIKDEEEEETPLPGFRFHPTDEELVGFYLRRKVEQKPLSIEIIKQVDIYKYDPWDLPKVSSSIGEKEWYFFCIRGRKYRNSIRPNRVTQSGFWKATGIDKPIFGGSRGGTTTTATTITATTSNESHVSSTSSSTLIGLKKTLVYYIGSAGKGTKTEWMMHEFRLPPLKLSDNRNIDIPPQAEVWTLCRILKRNASFRKYTPQRRTQGSRKFTDNGGSTSFSLELDNGDENIISGNSLFQQNKEEFADQHVQERKQNSTMSQLSFGDPNGEEEFGDAVWDELRRVVESAIDPFSLHQFG